MCERWVCGAETGVNGRKRAVAGLMERDAVASTSFALRRPKTSRGRKNAENVPQNGPLKRAQNNAGGFC